MTLTVRQSSVTGATTAGRALTYAEMDANWAHVIDSSNSTFTPSGTGGTTQNLQDRGRRLVYVTDYDGVGDSGTTENGAAYLKAHNALGADGGKLITPATTGYYDVTTQAAFTKPLKMEGDDWYCSEVGSSMASLVWFTTTAKLVAEGMSFTALGSAVNSCTFIKTLSSASNHGGTRLVDCFLSGAEKGYWSQRANSFHIDSCKIGCNYGLYLENTTSSDEGDSYISNCNIACTTSGVYVASTSGLYLTNNKFNGACAVHIDIANTDQNIGDIVIQGGSIEGHTTAGIRIIGTTGVCTKTIINGVQFSSHDMTHIIVGKGAHHTNISGCTFNDTNSANGIGIDVQTDAQNTVITGNHFHSIATAIQASATDTGLTIKGNRFDEDVTTYFVGDGGLNTHPSTKEIEVTRYTENTSNADYVNAFKFKGNCKATVLIEGTIQGVGSGMFLGEYAILGTTVTPLYTAYQSGTFDVQVTSSGGYVVVGIKRNGATGTLLTMYVTVKLEGNFTEFGKA